MLKKKKKILENNIRKTTEMDRKYWNETMILLLIKWIHFDHRYQSITLVMWSVTSPKCQKHNICNNSNTKISLGITSLCLLKPAKYVLYVPNNLNWWKLVCPV